MWLLRIPTRRTINVDTAMGRKCWERTLCTKEHGMLFVSECIEEYPVSFGVFGLALRV